jgi:hypothetical protein
MTQQNPITPPPELVEEWREQLFSHLDPAATVAVHELSCLAAQWGADQELEACCEWLNGGSKYDYDTAVLLRDARRPKPQSLKEQALKFLRQLENGEIAIGERANTIRRALEQLDD